MTQAHECKPADTTSVVSRLWGRPLCAHCNSPLDVRPDAGFLVFLGCLAPALLFHHAFRTHVDFWILFPATIGIAVLLLAPSRYIGVKVSGWLPVKSDAAMQYRYRSVVFVLVGIGLMFLLFAAL